jgi:hypothetical protein
MGVSGRVLRNGEWVQACDIFAAPISDPANRFVFNRPN